MFNKIISYLIAPLIVAVLGGLFIFHYTDWVKPKERLILTTEATASLEYTGEILSSQTFRVENLLPEKISAIEIFLRYSDSIDDIQVAWVGNTDYKLSKATLENSQIKNFISGVAYWGSCKDTNFCQSKNSRNTHYTIEI
ncbi:hypothetical protein [Pseudosulfitobacter koreensis]|uniref:hypothetical protein n=1 Tax=Pseudosulfitobacter koreensis TaxID=2968472 RepID=UPI00215AB6D5|nr:hypothetical protein [Pseudosulfitobacter koreense]